MLKTPHNQKEIKMKKVIISLAISIFTVQAYAADADNYVKYTVNAVRDKGANADNSRVEIKFCAYFNIYTNEDNWEPYDCKNPWNYDNNQPALEVTMLPKGNSQKKITMTFDNYSITQASEDDDNTLMFRSMILKAENSLVSVEFIYEETTHDDGSTEINQKKLVFKDKKKVIMGDLIARAPDVVSTFHSIEDEDN